MTVSCAKMQALGNDFVVVNMFVPPLAENELSRWARFLCSRRYGMGGDGLVLVCPSEIADVRMRIFNPDGSEAEMCGNALRSTGRFAYERGIFPFSSMTVETIGGIKRVYLEISGGAVTTVTAEVGYPDLRPEKVPVLAGEGGRCLDFPVELDGRIFMMSAMSMGNPHCVSFIDDVDTIDIDHYGRLMCHHPLFPEMVNAEFSQILDGGRLKMRVYERGVGETLACGTGCCVSVVAGYLTGRCESKAVISQRGGNIAVEFLPGESKLFMTGPTVFVYDAEVRGENMEDFVFGRE